MKGVSLRLILKVEGGIWHYFIDTDLGISIFFEK